MAMASAYYAATHFAINSDIDALLSNELDGAQREVAFESAFRRFQMIDVIVEAPTPGTDVGGDDGADRGARQGQGAFQVGHQFQRRQFLRPHGLLFVPKDQLKKSLDAMTQASRSSPIWRPIRACAGLSPRSRTC